MKVQDLKREDQSVLADFYESPEYKSLRGVIDGYIANWQADAINALTMEDLKELKGKVLALTQLTEFLKKNHKQNVQKSAPLSI
jgi:hypothetical protein